jgi:hypothetical protein
VTLEGKGKERAATQEERKGEIMTHDRRGKKRAVTHDRKSSDPGQVKEGERVNHDRRVKERVGTWDRREEVEWSDPEWKRGSS